MKKIVLAGGSGFIGRSFIRQLLERGDVVTVLTRSTRSNIPQSSVKKVFWDATTVGEWSNEIELADAVVNLAGEPIASKRWSGQQKNRIYKSRIESTRAIVQAIHQAHHKPEVFVNASAVGFYGNTADVSVTEQSSRGSGFLSEVCEQWEQEALKARADHVRVVTMRTGTVLSTKGGVLPQMLIPFQLFAGGYAGDGRQWFPWIHVDDAVSAMVFALEHPAMEGAVNVVAPESLRLKDFCSILGKVLHRPSRLAVPAWVIRFVFGEMGQELLLDGKKIIPQQLRENEFIFEFPALEWALENLFRQDR